jgi:hypothetical protein
MEQSSGKKERLMLAAGLALGLAAAAWQYFSPASNALMAGRDIGVALLGERSSVLLVYHPFSDTVNAFTSAHARSRHGASPLKRASLLAASALGSAASDQIFYVELSTAPSLDVLWDTLNSWRTRPRLLWQAAAAVYSLKEAGATNLSGFDLFMLFSEFLRLGSANFILTDVPRRGYVPEQDRQEEGAVAAPVRSGPYRVEVFNASGHAGLASRTAKRLRALGFDVITEGNHRTIEKNTRIVGFSSDTSAALSLRAALGLEEQEIRVNTSGKSIAGAAVILGQDFSSENKVK